MTIIWIPDGSLDVASSPSNLPQEAQGNTVISRALARSKNLEIVSDGKAQTRRGSVRINASALSGAISKILPQRNNRYTFTAANIYKDGTSIATISGAGIWDAVAYNAFNDTTDQIYALSGSVKKRVQVGTADTVTDWGITAPTVAPTLAVGALTGLTGDYNARYTYVRLVGAVVVSESNPSPAASAAVTLANQSLSITWTASSDSQVTHVRVYRTLTGGTTYFLDTTIAIGTTTLDTNTADTALGGLVEEDNDPPPDGSIVAGPFYDGVLFITSENLLYFCKTKRPESWPSTNFIEVGNRQNPIKCLTGFAGQAYALSQSKLWFIQGTGSSTFFPVPLESMTGAQGRFGAIGVEGRGIFHTGHDGIYLFSGGRDRKFSESRYDPLFRGETKGGMPAVDDIDEAWLFQHGNLLFFHYGDGSVIVFNLDNDRSFFYQYDQRLYAPAEHAQVGQFLVGDAGFFERALQSSNTDRGSAIAWEGQSKDYTLQTRAHFPRWVKYDTEGTMTGTVLLDDVTHQTHTITADRNTRRRLVDTGNGQRMSMRLAGSGVATIYAVEAE